MAGAQHLTKELLCGGGVSRGTQQKVQGLALGIDSAVEVMPYFLDLDVGFVHAIRIIRRLEMGATAAVELRGIALHPAKHGRVIDRETPLAHQFLDIAVAQSIAQIPPHTTHNDFRLKVTPL